MLKKYHIIIFFLGIFLYSGNSFAARDPICTRDEEGRVQNCRSPMYLEEKENGQKVYFCVGDDLYASQKGMDIIRQNYSDIDALYKQFPSFDEGITPSPSFALNEGATYKYWNTAAMYLDDKGDPVRYSYDIDVNNIVIEEGNNSACKFNRQVVDTSFQYFAFKTWTWENDSLNYNAEWNSNSLANYARPVVVYNQKTEMTEYTMGGYYQQGGINFSLDPIPIKEIYKNPGGGRQKVAFYDTEDIVLPSHKTFEYQDDGEGNPCRGSDIDPDNPGAGKQKNKDGSLKGCTVTHVHHHYQIEKPEIMDLIGSYKYENAIMIGDYWYIFLDDGEKAYYVTFKKHTELPEKPMSDSKTGNPKQTHHWLTGAFRYNGYLSGEHWVMVQEPTELPIQMRRIFDIRVLGNTEGSGQLILTGGSSKSIFDDASYLTENTQPSVEVLYDNIDFLPFNEGIIDENDIESFTLPEKQKNLKLMFSDDLKKFFLFGGQMGNKYYYLEAQGEDGNFDIDNFKNPNNWIKIILGSEEEELDLDPVTEFGIPAPINIEERGKNVTYQRYGAVEKFQYPQLLEFDTNMTGIMPQVVVRVWRCGSRLKPKICKEWAPRFIIGNTKIPIHIQHSRGGQAKLGNNKIFRSSRIITSVTPLTTLTKDNVISFVGNVQVSPGAKENPLEELRIHSIYFIEDGESLPVPVDGMTDILAGKFTKNENLNFYGYNQEFFNSFFKIRPVQYTDQLGVSLVNYNGRDWRANYSDADGGFRSWNVNNGVGPGNSVCDFCQLGQFILQYELPQKYHAHVYTGEGTASSTRDLDLEDIGETSFLWNKKFSPGQHRIHMLVTVANSRTMLDYKVRGNLIAGLNGSPLIKGAGPHRWNVEPDEIGLDVEHSQVKGPIKVYYQAYTIDFVVPEITNFSSETGIAPIPVSRIEALNIPTENQNLIFYQDPEDPNLLRFQMNQLQDLYDLPAYAELSSDLRDSVVELWREFFRPQPTIINSIRPTFTLEKTLDYNTVDFYLGENVIAPTSVLPDDHELAGMRDNDRYMIMPMSAPLNDLPLNVSGLSHEQIGFDGNTQNVAFSAQHTPKAHLVRSNRNGEIEYSPQMAMYPLDNLTEEQKEAIANEGVSNSYYKIFSVVTDEQGNKLGAPPVYLSVENNPNKDLLHIYEVERNHIRGAWRPFQSLKLVQGGQEYFVGADKNGNFSVFVHGTGDILFHKQNEEGEWTEIKNKEGNSFTVSIGTETIPQLTNFVSGDVFYSSQPLFEGVAEINSNVYYRIYWRDKASDTPLDYFEEKNENYHRLIERGVVQANNKGYFSFMPRNSIVQEGNLNDIYYIELGEKFEDIDEGIWPNTSVTSIRYQNPSYETSFTSSETLLAGTAQNNEDYLRYGIDKYIFGLFSGTESQPDRIQFTTPAHITLRTGQMIALSSKQQIKILSDLEKGALFYLSKGSKILDKDTKIKETVIQTGVFSYLNQDGTVSGLKKEDEIIAPDKGAIITVLSEEVELIIPAGTEIFATEMSGEDKDSCSLVSSENCNYKVIAHLDVQEEFKDYIDFDFADTQFYFANLESVFHTECRQTESLNPANIVRGTVERCRLMSEMVYPKTRDPQLFFPHNGEVISQSQKLELMGFAWPNSVLQIVLGSRHAGAVTTDKNGRFYWRASQIYDFQIPGTEIYEEVQNNGLEISILDRENKAVRIAVRITFSDPGSKLEDYEMGVPDVSAFDNEILSPQERQRIKDLFLEKMQVSEDNVKDGYNAIPKSESFFGRVKHYFQNILHGNL